MIERIKQVMAQLMAEFARPQAGFVWDYDPERYAVKVEMQPSGVKTGWVPLSSPWVGNGFGMVAGPNIGDMVQLEFIDGHWQAAMTGQRYFTDLAPPPQVPQGEFWLVHQTGSLIKLHNDGSVEITSNGNMTVTVSGNLNANISGTATVTAPTITANGAVTINGSLNVA